jgi:hypothetical protein
MPTHEKCQLLPPDARRKHLWKGKRNFGCPCQLSDCHWLKIACCRHLVPYCWSTARPRVSALDGLASNKESQDVLAVVNSSAASSEEIEKCQWKHAVFDKNLNIKDASDKLDWAKSWQLFSRGRIETANSLIHNRNTNKYNGTHFQGRTNFPRTQETFKILGAKMVTRSKYHTEYLQLSGAAAK